MRLSSMTYSGRAEERTRLVVLIALALCTVSTILIIANIDSVPFGSGPSFNLYLSRISNFILPSAAALWFIALILILLQRRLRYRVPSKNRSGLDQASVLGILAFLTIAVVVAAISGPQNQSTPGNQGSEGGGDQEGGAQNLQPSSFSSPAGFLSLLPFIIMLALVFLLSLRHMKTSRSFVMAEAPPNSEIKALEKAIDAMGKESDLRSAILRIYAEMCTMVADPEAEIALTPRELERLVTERLGWPKRPVHQLTQIFEEARYSNHDLEEEDGAMALDSLNELKMDLEDRANAQRA